MANSTTFVLAPRNEQEQIQPHNAYKLIQRVPVAVTLGRFLRRQTKLDNFSKLHLRSRLRSPEVCRYVKLNHLCHDNLLDLIASVDRLPSAFKLQ
jgi:hypothetical protein